MKIQCPDCKSSLEIQDKEYQTICGQCGAWIQVDPENEDNVYTLDQ